METVHSSIIWSTSHLRKGLATKKYVLLVMLHVYWAMYLNAFKCLNEELALSYACKHMLNDLRQCKIPLYSCKILENYAQIVGHLLSHVANYLHK